MVDRDGWSQSEKDAESYFDRWASSYDEGRITPWFRYTQELTIGNLDLRPGSRVLDVGCGTGWATLHLATLLPEGSACGLDLSHQMVDEASSKIPPELKDRVEFRQGNSADLPFEAGSFTHLICTNSFHHYPDPLRALAEMRRVLVPGGQIAIFENAPDLSWYTWAWDRLLRIIEKGHVRYLPSAELGALLSRAGLVDCELRVLRNEFRKHGKLFASIQVWSARTPNPDPAPSARQGGGH
jgi:ubiquinone/menaquinone biosynthesis C-methylase UbiE